jgi:hypothetical protein
LADRPSKHFVCDALDGLSTFVKTQRKKIHVRSEKKRRVVVPIVPYPPPGDDDDDDDDGPPPLEPVSPIQGGLDDVD